MRDEEDTRMADYKIRPVAVEGFADADGVVENWRGAWLGSVELETPDGPEVVLPYADDDGDFVPAPENWRDLVIATL
jgi:hypothetical protein